MSIAAFAISQSAVAQVVREGDGRSKAPPKRTLTAIADTQLIPEAR